MQAVYAQLLYLLIFRTGSGGCGLIESEKLHKATTMIGRVLICLLLKRRDHFLYQLMKLLEEFICDALSSRLSTIQLGFFINPERQHFVREDETPGEIPGNDPKEYGVRSLISASMTHSDECSRDVAMAPVVFKLKPVSLMRFIQSNQVLGIVSTFVWRIEYQKRGLRHAGMLLCTKCDTQAF
jgi:hypothetical protein